ncbi:MAG: 5-formyltetrahydrofolate cyclo-ligase [Armatimonadota bacterium]
MPVDLRPIKAELRKEILRKRDELSPDEVTLRGTNIAQAVCALPIFSTADTICSYVATAKEVQTVEIIRAALTAGKRVALPRTVMSGRELVLHQVSDLDHLIPGPYDILEPSPEAPVIDPAQVELFLIPGSVFDPAGNRLGYGAGFYDSLLVLSEGWRVALAYAFQVQPHVPYAEHDMPMDLIVTEYGPIDCEQGQLADDHLRLRNMTFYGHHGAFPQEREQGIRLAVDLDLRLDLQVPGRTDDLSTTVNYPAVYRLINHIQSNREFALFEALADEIALAVLQEFSSVAAVTVTARKFHPPVGGLMDAFEVEITRSRPAWRHPYGA